MSFSFKYAQIDFATGNPKMKEQKEKHVQSIIHFTTDITYKETLSNQQTAFCATMINIQIIQVE